MNVTEHFTLRELTHSDVALRQGIDNTPSPEVADALTKLAAHILEPVRQHFVTPFSPSSGYRCIKLNRLIGSNDNSQHVKGQAVDFKIPGNDNYDIAFWIYQNLDFDQIILECYTPGDPQSGWVHCSYVETGNRKDVLTYTGREYLHGLIS
ncbi:peptidase M15A [Sneathiella sp. P13V-1]|uniref:D-Ala-D-Ala carboxypeptidase family metallohydrolase n=1 Tax=Sneathiella sp. P13V-1 TaxID=2697366 RepID=UPI00187B9A2C|nr:D-Ala-D-Ala carboxypeptidase family metallohydrolase [Sneathiella sp. P13V-1]MBE7636653.1 peptidase M15A [Sneathiella sp. P13V-1]